MGRENYHQISCPMPRVQHAEIGLKECEIISTRDSTYLQIVAEQSYFLAHPCDFVDVAVVPRG